MATEFLTVARLSDSDYIAGLFDSQHCDALEVRDEGGGRVGVAYLEDFCNMRELNIEKYAGSGVLERNEDEGKLLTRVLGLSSEETGYVRDAVLRKIGDDFVCCCDCRKTAESIVERVFGCAMVGVRYAESVFDLNDGDRVLFLSFNRIKLYRKAHKGRIVSMVALNNVVQDSENRTVFYGKYQDLIDSFSSIGVTCLYGIIPEAGQLSGMGEAARNRVAGHGKADYDFCAELLGGADAPDFASCQKQNELSRVVDNGMFKSLLDCRSDYYNVAGGMRLTLGQPDVYEHTAYLFGPCTARGAMVSDAHTVASILQKRLNEAGGGWLVLNCGVGGGTDLENTYRYALSLPLKAGDAVLFLEAGGFLDEKTVDGVTIFKLSDAFNTQPPAGEWFLDRPAHCNAEANAVIAHAFFHKLRERISAAKCAPVIDANGCKRGAEKIYSDSLELKKYIGDISNLRFELKSGECAGAILMHCNPMTLGHLFLIEEALREVNFLYVFLLSVDKSEIPYAIRREMLLHETRGLPRVRVLDCGEFMGSPKVFPAYFTKDSKRHSRIDATKEILVFCQHVAPVLEISKRFVGTESRDFVTRQYNNQLKLILPSYGIELREIKRKIVEGKDVSAYLTRSLIRDGRWDEVGKQVSAYSLSLLRRFYEEKNAKDRTE